MFAMLMAFMGGLKAVLAELLGVVTMAAAIKAALV